jgi:hypothetical protein
MVGYLRRTVQAAVALVMMSVAHLVIAQETGAPYRVGFLSQPASCEPAWIRKIEWNRENIGTWKDLGFTAIQVDVAWTRPDDEVLCIEGACRRSLCFCSVSALLSLFCVWRTT